MAENHSPDNVPKPILSDSAAAVSAPPDEAPAGGSQPTDSPRRRATDVLGALSTIEAQLAALRQTQADHEQEITQAQEALSRREHELSALAASVRDRQAALQARESELSGREAAAAEAEQRIETERASIEAERRLLDAQRAEADQRAADAESRAGALAELEAGLARREEAAGDAEKLRSHLESAHAEIDTLTRELTAARDACERASTAVEAFRSQVGELTGERDEAAAHREAASRQIEELQARISKVTQQRDRARAEADDLMKSALSPARVEQLVEEGITKAREEWERARGGDAASATAEVESVRARLGDAEAARDAAIARADAAERASIEADRRAAEAQSQAKAATIAAQVDPRQPAAVEPQELAKRDAAIKALRERMLAAQQEKAALEAKLAESAAELDRLRAQPAQPSPMSGAMAGVSAAAHEQLSEERSKIVKMREALTERERAITAKAGAVAACAAWAKASYTAAAMLGCLFACAAASWVASGRIAAPTFNARAQLAIDDRERTATPEKLRAWEEYHEKLVLDPQLMDQVAGRMRLRGVESLADPSDVHDMLEERLDVAADGAGGISLTLRGRGAQPTERVLETLLTSYISLANSTRDMRRDGCGVMVVSPAKADAEPVSASGRMNAFLLCFGGSSVVFLLVVLKLASTDRSRDRFAREVAPEAGEEHRIEVA